MIQFLRLIHRYVLQKDVEALREGLADGTIDIVATDHAPHPAEAKECEWQVSSLRNARLGKCAIDRQSNYGADRTFEHGKALPIA